MKFVACMTDGWKTHLLAIVFVLLTLALWARHDITPGTAYDGIEIALFGAALRRGQQKQPLL